MIGVDLAGFKLDPKFNGAIANGFLPVLSPLPLKKEFLPKRLCEGSPAELKNPPLLFIPDEATEPAVSLFIPKSPTFDSPLTLLVLKGFLEVCSRRAKGEKSMIEVRASKGEFPLNAAPDFSSFFSKAKSSLISFLSKRSSSSSSPSKYVAPFCFLSDLEAFLERLLFPSPRIKS